MLQGIYRRNRSKQTNMDYNGKEKGNGITSLGTEEKWGRSAAKKIFHEKQIVISMHFDSIWWSGYDRAISKYPKTFCSFITKQVSGWCGCNSKLSLWEDNIINKCPHCGLEHENSKHLTRCRDPGWLLQLHKSTKSIMDILDDVNVASELTEMIKTNLLNQGHQTMGDCTHPNSIFSPISVDIDNLGWECFVEGWIPQSLIIAIKPMYIWYNPHGLVDIWGSRLIKSLIGLTHKQWLFWNSDMRYISKGLTEHQHDELTARIRKLMKTKHKILLPRHRHFIQIDLTNSAKDLPSLARFGLPIWKWPLALPR